MNVQFAVQNEVVYVLEVNPRASRTVPFVSKSIGVPLAKIAALVMAGASLKELGFTREVKIKHFCVKEAVFPFNRFPGTDVILSPEMKSTGEVMGVDVNEGIAYLKSQIAAANALPMEGNVFISVRDEDKQEAIKLAERLHKLCYIIYATLGTSTALRNAGIPANAAFRISAGRPNVLDLMAEKKVGWIINTPTTGEQPKADEIKMRAEAVMRGIPITTTLAGFKAAVAGLEALHSLRTMDVCSLQEYHRRAPKLKL
jgi:carbamoyl-phosphate synthase large subunit